MKKLLEDIAACTLCSSRLPLGPRPVVTAHPESKIIIIGQAPGIAVHKSGISWNDQSGDNLRRWMQVDKPIFYNPEEIALIPMGFCYPGKGRSGDMPPRKECAPLWHSTLLAKMKNVKLTLLVGKYAQDYYLPYSGKRTLTETVKNFEAYLPRYFVLPHPSPRNNIWREKNKWFGAVVVPRLRAEVKKALSQDGDFNAISFSPAFQ